MSSRDVKQDFPRLDTPVVEPTTGIVSKPWHRLFIEIWKKAGGGLLQVAETIYMGQTPAQAGVSISAYRARDGVRVGDLLLTNVGAAPAEPQVLAGSPFVYTATRQGTLTVFSGQVEISRDNGLNWYLIGLMGGAIPMLRNDRVRVTWFQVDKPTVVFFPVASA